MASFTGNKSIADNLVQQLDADYVETNNSNSNLQQVNNGNSNVGEKNNNGVVVDTAVNNDVIDYSGYSQLDATYNNLSESDDEFGEYVSITDNRVEDFSNTNNNKKKKQNNTTQAQDDNIPGKNGINTNKMDEHKKEHEIHDNEELQNQQLLFANFNKEEDEKVRKEKYNITSNDEIVKIMKEMKWKPKRVMHSLKP